MCETDPPFVSATRQAYSDALDGYVRTKMQRGAEAHTYYVNRLMDLWFDLSEDDVQYFNARVEELKRQGVLP